MDQPLCEKRGGLLLRNGRVSFLGREIYLPYFSASPPLAKLCCFTDSITITVGPITLAMATNDIEEVRFRKKTLWSLLLGGDTLTIRHHGRESNPVIFGTWSGLERITHVLQDMGVNVVAS